MENHFRVKEKVLIKKKKIPFLKWAPFGVAQSAPPFE
jgi:hypothetical protein